GLDYFHRSRLVNNFRWTTYREVVHTGPNPLFYQSSFLSRGDFEGDYFLRFLTASNLAYSIVLTADLKPRLVELRRR
ncbi:hypothetical protein HID58_060672, partial [Brassica napus]